MQNLFTFYNSVGADDGGMGMGREVAEVASRGEKEVRTGVAGDGRNNAVIDNGDLTAEISIHIAGMLEMPRVDVGDVLLGGNAPGSLAELTVSKVTVDRR